MDQGSFLTCSIALSGSSYFSAVISLLFVDTDLVKLLPCFQGNDLGLKAILGLSHWKQHKMVVVIVKFQSL